jgi:hypothetical protein
MYGISRYVQKCLEISALLRILIPKMNYMKRWKLVSTGIQAQLSLSGKPKVSLTQMPTHLAFLPIRVGG